MESKSLRAGPSVAAVAVVVAVWAIAPARSAADPLRTSEPDSVQTVVAGDSVVHVGQLAVGRTEKHLELVRGDSVRDYGVLVQTLARVTVDGVPGLLSVQFSPKGLFPTDSAFADPETLRPLWQRSHSARRDMRLQFDGARVSGSYAPADSVARAINQTLPAAPFDANVGDLVVAALPLEVGRTFRVPTYIYERGGVVWESVEVRGRERYQLGPRSLEVYVVDVRDSTGSATYRVTTRPPRRVVETVRDLGPRGRVITRIER
jgi:hypothetical protein